MRRLPSLVLLVCVVLPLAPARAGDFSSMEEKALPRVLIQRGERFLNLGKPKAALACYAKVIACCEGTAEAAEAHNDRGVALTRLGRPDEALAEYEKSLAGGYPLAHFNLGQALLRRFEASGDPAAGARARESFAAFGRWLDSGEPLPPAVSYNLQELREFLAQAAKALEK